MKEFQLSERQVSDALFEFCKSRGLLDDVAPGYLDQITFRAQFNLTDDGKLQGATVSAWPRKIEQFFAGIFR